MPLATPLAVPLATGTSGYVIRLSLSAISNSCRTALSDEKTFLMWGGNQKKGKGMNQIKMHTQVKQKAKEKLADKLVEREVWSDTKQL